MTPQEATTHTIELGKEHISEQEERITRQRALIAKLSADGHTERAAAAQQMLSDMLRLLDRWKREVAEAEQRLRSYQDVGTRRAS